VGAQHRDCRNAVEDSDAFPELSVGLLVAQSETKKRENRRSDFSAGMERSEMKGESLLN